MTPSPPCRIAVGPTTDTALAALHTRRKRKSTIRTMRNIAACVTWDFFNSLLLLAPFDNSKFYSRGEPLNLLAVQPSHLAQRQHFKVAGGCTAPRIAVFNNKLKVVAVFSHRVPLE